MLGNFFFLFFRCFFFPVPVSDQPSLRFMESREGLVEALEVLDFLFPVGVFGLPEPPSRDPVRVPESPFVCLSGRGFPPELPEGRPPACADLWP